MLLLFQAINSDESRVMLLISNVGENHITSYYLLASNDVGKANVTLSVHKEGSVPTDVAYSYAQSDATVPGD